jgi:DNA-binding transcriptional LysR family regulator
MNLRQLEIFGAVMRTGSTSAAARALNISQPAVSNMVRYMESQLGFPLFYRVKGRLVPTMQANALVAQAQDVFDAFARTSRLADQLKRNEAGQLKLSMVPSLGNTVVPRAVVDFLKQRPHVKVSLEMTAHDAVVDVVERDLVDLGIVFNTFEHEEVYPAVRAEKVARGAMVCVFSPESALAAKHSITPSDLLGERIIVYPRDYGLFDRLYAVFQKSGLYDSAPVELQFFHTACMIASYGGGAAVVDEFTAADQAKAHPLEVRPFEPAIEVTISILFNRNRPMSTLASAFIPYFIANAPVAAQSAGRTGI